MIRLGELTGSSGEADRDRLAKLAITMQACGVSDDADVLALFVPGRLEILGKHTDYAGGRSLTMAIDRGFWLLAHPRPDPSMSIVDRRSNEHRRLDLSALEVESPSDWSIYPYTVARRLERDFPRQWRGADVVFESTLPRAAGLSSSSAMIIAFYLVLARVNDLESDSKFVNLLSRQMRRAEDVSSV